MKKHNISRSRTKSTGVTVQPLLAQVKDIKAVDAEDLFLKLFELPQTIAEREGLLKIWMQVTEIYGKLDKAEVLAKRSLWAHFKDSLYLQFIKLKSLFFRPKPTTLEGLKQNMVKLVEAQIQDNPSANLRL